MNEEKCAFKRDDFMAYWWYDPKKDIVIFDVQEQIKSPGKRYTAIAFGDSMKVT